MKNNSLALYVKVKEDEGVVFYVIGVEFKCFSLIMCWDEEMLCKCFDKCCKAFIQLNEYRLILCQQQRQNKWCKRSIG